MKRIPSVRTLRAVFGDHAPSARRILEATRSELLAYPAAEARSQECFHSPPTYDLRLHVLDQLAGTCGVEGATIDTRNGQESFSYLNTGDAYAATLVRWRGEYVVTSWGDIVERHTAR